MLMIDRKSTRLNSSHVEISYAVFCLKKKIKRWDSHANQESLVKQLLQLLCFHSCCQTSLTSKVTKKYFTAFFLNDTAPPEIYTLSLHDALPIAVATLPAIARAARLPPAPFPPRRARKRPRSEEHTSELESRRDLVCRLLLE